MNRRHSMWVAGLALAAGLARADVAGDMRAAEALRQEGRHEEAIQAYLALAERCTDIDQRFEAVRAAAACARLHTPGGEARALALCDQAGPAPYPMACRATVYEWMTVPSNVVADLGSEDIAAWPEALAAVGFSARSRAYFAMSNGPAAAADFLRAFQFGKSYAKWAALQRLGDTYWKLLDDELLAEACYRKCMADFGGGWPGLQARVNLGELLVAQERYDAALQALKGMPHIGGTWKASLLLVAARAHAGAGQKAEAVQTLNDILATHGIHPAQKEAAEKLLAEYQGAAPAP